MQLMSPSSETTLQSNRTSGGAMTKFSRRDKQTDFNFRKVESALGSSKVIGLQTVLKLYRNRHCHMSHECGNKSSITIPASRQVQIALAEVILCN